MKDPQQLRQHSDVAVNSPHCKLLFLTLMLLFVYTGFHRNKWKEVFSVHSYDFKSSDHRLFFLQGNTLFKFVMGVITKLYVNNIKTEKTEFY